ncbi:hypothetical protein [Clostridium magnum]|nr:hypothetical protein [Clostridium magnum]
MNKALKIKESFKTAKILARGAVAIVGSCSGAAVTGALNFTLKLGP